MPNIIVLDPDDRTAKQITSCLGSFADAEYRLFKTCEQFSETYFDKNRLDSAKGHLDAFETFRLISTRARQWTLISAFHDGDAIGGDSLTIRSTFPLHAVTDWERDETSEFLGFPAAEISDEKSLFVDRVADAYKKDFEEFIKACSLGAQNKKLFVFKCKNTLHAALEVSGAPGPDNTVVLTFSDINQEFVEALEKEKKRISALKQQMAELKLLRTVDLIIVRYDLIKMDAKEALKSFLKDIQEFGFAPENFRTRIVVVKYEDDGVTKSEIALPEIDALVFYPIDKSIFLQTLEILRELPEKAEPTHLFNQDVDMEIDICKSSILYSMNEFCIAVVNPVSLATGLLGHFYIKLKDQEIRISGKVFRSVIHPENPRQHIVFFSFFGMNSKTTVLIKKFLADFRDFKMLKETTRSTFRFDPSRTDYGLNDLTVKNVVVVNSDESELQKIKGIVEDDFDRLSITTATSFHQLISKYLPAKQGKGTALHPATEEDFPIENFNFIYHKETHEIEAIDDRLADTANLFLMGSPLAELRRKDKWKTLLGDSETLLLREVSRSLDRSQQKHIMELQHTSGGTRIVTAYFSEETTKTIRLEFRIPKQNEVKDYLAPPHAIDRLDALFVDTRLLSAAADEWIRELDNILADRNLEVATPLVFLTSAKIDKEKVDSYSDRRFASLFHTSTDQRQIQFALSQFLQSRFNQHTFNNLNFVEIKSKIHIAKPVRLEQASEYGATLLHPKPFSYGAFLFLRGEIFQGAQDGFILARFYYNEKSENFPDQQSCSLLYFGINESFLKSIRKWFFELHIEANKEQN